MRVFHPEVFQGSINRKNYFEGWYLKHVSADLSQVYAFIPGISTAKGDQHAFIQIINGITGETHYISYPIDSFRFNTDKFWVQVGESTFSEEGLELKIDDENVQVEGKIEYQGISKFPGSIKSPGIMGWYSYVPFMECYHGIVSANHSLSGSLSINEHKVSFDGGHGYIEKDWGISFPECWIWLQSNSFDHPETSLFVSVAKIPWLGSFFMGYIAFLYHRGTYHIFATYNGSKLRKVKRTPEGMTIELANSRQTLQVEVKVNSAGELIAPVRGEMNRRIKESLDSSVSVKLMQGDENVYSGFSKRAGLEVIEKIFDYL